MSHAPNRYKRWSLGRWYGFTKMQTRVAKRLGRIITVSENSFKDIVADHEVDPANMAHRARRRRPRPVQAAARDRAHPRPPDHHRQRRRHHEGPQVPARGAGQAPHRARRRSTSSSSARRSRAARRARPSTRLGLRDHVEFVTGVPERRIVELYSEAELAVVPSLYEGFSLPAIEAMSCGVPAGRHHRRRHPRGRRPRRRDRHARRRPATARPSPPASASALDDPSAPRAHRPRRPRSGSIDNWSWRHTAERTVEQYRIRLGQTSRRSALMLTVDYDRLGLQPGRARPRPRLRRRPPRLRVVRAAAPASSPSTTTSTSWRQVARPVGAMAIEGEIDRADDGAAVPRRRASGCPFPDDTFDRIIAAEVLEHIPDDDGAIAELHRVLKPGRHDRRHRARRGWPSRSAGRCPTSTTPPSSRAATSASTPRPSCAGSCARVGLEPGDAHHAHALHSPYWWLRCAVDPQHPTTTRWSRRTTASSSGTSPTGPLVTRLAEALLNPVIGKSLVVYATKPARRRRRAPTPTRRRGRPHDPRRRRPAHRRPRSTPRPRPSPTGSCPSGMIPWFPGGHADPWNHVEAAMALDLGGRARRGRAGLRVARRPAAARRRLAPVLPRGRRVVRSSRTSSTPTSCAYVAAGVWHHFLRHKDTGFLETLWPTVERAIDFVLDLQTPAGRDPLGPPRRRHAVVVRPAHRLVEHLPLAAVRHRHRRTSSATSGPTGSRRRPRWPTSSPRARRLRPQAPLGDGLVLPGPRRRRRRRRRPRPPRRPLRDLRRRGQGHPLRVRPPVDHHGRDLRVRARLPRRRRCATGPSSCSPTPSTQRLDDGHYWTGIVYPQEVHFPGRGDARPTPRPPSSSPPRRSTAPRRRPRCSSTTTSVLPAAPRPTAA